MERSIQIPNFSLDNPDEWFEQLESQFLIHTIRTEDMMFNYLLAGLGSKFVPVIDWVIKKDIPNKYTVAKQCLIEMLESSETYAVLRLLESFKLEQMKPSELLLKLQSACGSRVSKLIVRTLWLDKMPDHVKSILSCCEDTVDTLALMADKIIVLDNNKKMLEQILNKVSALEQQVDKLNQEMSEEHTGTICYFHAKYGKNCMPAKCKPPCNWKMQDDD